jgi:hypothetical protein
MAEQFIGKLSFAGSPLKWHHPIGILFDCRQVGGAYSLIFLRLKAARIFFVAILVIGSKIILPFFFENQSLVASSSLVPPPPPFHPNISTFKHRYLCMSNASFCHYFPYCALLYILSFHFPLLSSLL